MMQLSIRDTVGEPFCCLLLSLASRGLQLTDAVRDRVAWATGEVFDGRRLCLHCQLQSYLTPERELTEVTVSDSAQDIRSGRSS